MIRLLFLCLILLASLPAAPAAELWVAPGGADTNPGTAEAPFATLQRARDAVRALKAAGPPAGGVTVWVRGGVYRLEATLAFDAQDSGSADAPVVYRAAPGETPRIVGGLAIEPEALEPVIDQAVLARIDPAAREAVRVVDLEALGAQVGEAWPEAFRGYAGWPELFFDRRPMQIARWPNEGFAQVAKVVDVGSKPRWNEKPDRPGTFEYSGDRPERWLSADEVYLEGYWAVGWYSESLKVAAIDPAAKTITFTRPHTYGLGGPSGGHFFALGLLEELDTPGEYYVDRNAGRLYFWPPAPVEGREIGLSLLKEPLVAFNNASHVTLRGLTLEYARGQAVTIRNGERVALAGCTLRNIATDAVRIDGGREHVVRSCDLYELGGAGISLNGGDRATLTAAGHLAENNHIHHFGRIFRTHKDAIYLGGVGNRAQHNLIHDAPHHAMDFGGNLHVVELNEIHDVCTETDDAGAIYTGRNWTVRGTVIRHNYFHDIGGDAHVGNQAIYVDDTAAGIISVGNVIQRVHRGFLIGGGRDNVIDNNLLIDCRIPIHIDNRGMSWSGEGTENWTTLMKGLEAVPYQEEPWRSVFPALVNVLEDEPGLPKGNRVTDNVMVDCGPMNLAKEVVEHGTVEGNWATPDDPGFADAAALDFALRPDSRVFEQVPGFEPIPFERIGLYLDEDRPLLPVRRPVVSPAGGAFVETATVTLANDRRSPDAVIRYTLDGSAPTEASAVYQEPLTLTDDAVVRAAAFGSAGGRRERSETVTVEFTAYHLGAGAGVPLGDLTATETLGHGGVKMNANYGNKGPVSLRGQAFERSILMHPAATPEGGRSQAVFELPGGLARATRLTATVGVDDAVGERGSVTFAVEARRGGEWQRVWESGVLRGGQATADVDADISGADAIRLITTDAGDDMNADHAVWVEPTLR